MCSKGFSSRDNRDNLLHAKLREEAVACGHASHTVWMFGTITFRSCKSSSETYAQPSSALQELHLPSAGSRIVSANSSCLQRLEAGRQIMHPLASAVCCLRCARSVPQRLPSVSNSLSVPLGFTILANWLAWIALTYHYNASKITSINSEPRYIWTPQRSCQQEEVAAGA